MTNEYRQLYNNFKKSFGEALWECVPEIYNEGASRHITVLAGVHTEDPDYLTEPWSTFIGKGLFVESEIGRIYLKYGNQKITPMYARKKYEAWPIMAAVYTQSEFKEEFIHIVGKALKASYYADTNKDPLSVFDERFDERWASYVSELNPSDIVKIVSGYFDAFDYVVEYVKLISKFGSKLDMATNRDGVKSCKVLDPIIVNDMCYDFRNKIYGVPMASYFGEVIRRNGNTAAIDFDASRITELTLTNLSKAVDIEQFKTLCEHKAV